ncbi:Rv3235 family protein [Jiangella muralis]|uniref:Rv3235 family protein n=1 Tax=Jiangella muralis TaxID=702383 RepID=UPI00069DAAFE|nr:Rv3235 family protein [Jiangella muralis]
MTATSAPPEPYVSRVRLLPVPVTEPPFDDELGIVVPRGERRPLGAATAVQGTLPLELDADVFEDQLRPIGVGAAVVADSLWLRNPGPEPTRGPRDVGSDGATSRVREGGRAGEADAGERAAPAARRRPARPDAGAGSGIGTAARAGTGTGTAARSTTRAATAVTTGPATATRATGTAGTGTAVRSATRAGTRAAAGPATAAAAAAGSGAAAWAETATAAGADELPDPRRWTARLAQSALECLHGRRPLQQLVRWTAEPVYRDLSRRAVAQDEAPAVRPRIRALRVCRVTPGVAEASVVVQIGAVARAVAVRLEADDGRWLCTAFDIAEPRPARRGTRRGATPGAASNGARSSARGQRAAQASSNASA